MIKIEELEKNINEEYDDAEKYAMLALRHQTDDKDLAELYFRLAKEEIGHADRLHEAAVKIIEEIKRTGYEVPAGMMEFYNYLHEQDIRHAAKVMNVLQQYK